MNDIGQADAEENRLRKMSRDSQCGWVVGGGTMEVSQKNKGTLWANRTNRKI